MAAADRSSFHGIIGRSAAMQALFRRIERVAPIDVPVLIQGESGTGKELIASAVHRLSGRRDRPLQTVNSGALPRELLLSELFGHERGAFTGAVTQKAGLLAAAHGGTLFLDEVAELSPEGQVALLRFLQEGEIRAVGSTVTRRVDVRVIAATHRRLSDMIAAGTFRDDLYYRLRWVVLAVPPLRERPDDIPLLVEHFRAKLNQRFGLAISGFSARALACLEDGPWPGNVRELETVLAQALLLRGEGQVQIEDLAQPDETGAGQSVREPVPKRPAPDLDELLEWPQQEALRIAAARGQVRRGDLTARCGISTESARKYLVGLVERRLLQRAGGGRGVRYVLVRPRVDHDRELRARPEDRKRNADGRKRKEAQPGGKP
jgi:DNA-binding NtrC family response regulator